MGVDNNALRLAEATAQDDIGCFSTHSRQAYQLVKRLGNLASKPFDQPLAAAFDVLRLGSEKTGSKLAAASLAGVGHFWNRPGVTRLTRLSVHWAERIVAISS